MNKFAAAFAVLLTITSPVLAGSPCTDNRPPSKFAFEPDPSSYTLITNKTGAWLKAQCDTHYACTFFDTRTVYIASDLTTEKCGDGISVSSCKRCLLTHEWGHLNGWRHPAPTNH